MNGRPWAQSFWPLAVVVLGYLAAIALRASQPDELERTSFSGTPVLYARAITGVTTALIAGLILQRLPGHAVGRIFAAVAVLGTIADAGTEYAWTSLFATDALPGGIWVGWLTSWIWFGEIVLLASALPQLFPTGRPLGPRWRPLLILSALAFALAAGMGALAAGPLETVPSRTNPIGVLDRDSARPLYAAVFTALFGAIGGGVAAMVIRFQRSTGMERQQMKWIVYSLALFAATFVIAAVIHQRGASSEIDPSGPIIVSGALVPLAAGIAILRYRLYDIDLLINRTLVYGATSATLVVTYALVVLALGTALRQFTQGSELAVAGSTLAVAALVQPVRRRIQTAVDRRFYRARYDAERTVEGFAHRLRDEVDLEALRGALVGVVRDTVRPAHASLWLRDRNDSRTAPV